MDDDSKAQLLRWFGLEFLDPHTTPENWLSVLLEEAADLETVTEAWVHAEFQKRGWMSQTAAGVLVPWGGDCRNFKHDPDEYSD
jgi:hypothetical protein